VSPAKSSILPQRHRDKGQRAGFREPGKFKIESGEFKIAVQNSKFYIAIMHFAL
jgi:hypothetical protein